MERSDPYSWEPSLVQDFSQLCDAHIVKPMAKSPPLLSSNPHLNPADNDSSVPISVEVVPPKEYAWEILWTEEFF